MNFIALQSISNSLGGNLNRSVSRVGVRAVVEDEGVAIKTLLEERDQIDHFNISFEQVEEEFFSMRNKIWNSSSFFWIACATARFRQEMITVLVV